MRSKMIPKRKYLEIEILKYIILTIIIIAAITTLARVTTNVFTYLVDVKVQALESAEIEPQAVITEEVALCYPLTDYERQMVESVVMAEAGAESLLGQMAVAQVILDRAVLWDMSITEVTEQNGQFVTYNGEVNESCRLAVSNVFDLGEKAIEENITHFYSGNEEPYWTENKESRGSIQGHKFYY